jgi:ankyrin repeat protein
MVTGSAAILLVLSPVFADRGVCGKLSPVKSTLVLLAAFLGLVYGCAETPTRPPAAVQPPAPAAAEPQAPPVALAPTPAPPAAPTQSSIDALFRSISNGDLGEFSHLINNGVHHSTLNKLGETPLYVAAEKGELEIVRLLIARGADAKALTPNGETVLHAASMIESSALMTALIEAGAPINLANRDGEAPLHWAALTGTFLAVKALADAGADLNVQDAQRGNTALHSAVHHNDIVLIHYLLSKNVRTDIRNKAGFTAPEFAKARGRASVKLFER